MASQRCRYDTALTVGWEWIACVIQLVAFSIFAIIAGTGLVVFGILPMVMFFRGSADPPSLALAIALVVIGAGTILLTVTATVYWTFDRSRLWHGIEVKCDGVTFVGTRFSTTIHWDAVAQIEFGSSFLTGDKSDPSPVCDESDCGLIQLRVHRTGRARPLSMWLNRSDAEECRPGFLEYCSGVPCGEMPALPDTEQEPSGDVTTGTAADEKEMPQPELPDRVAPDLAALRMKDLRIVQLAVGLLGLGSAAIGAIDADIPGFVAGALIGSLAGFLLGHLLKALVVAIIAIRDNRDGPLEGQESQSGIRKWCFVRWCQFFVLLVLQFVMCHEFYWFGNMLATSVSHDTGALLTRSTARKDSREFLRDKLRERRWRHAVVSARPARWVLRNRTLAVNEMTLEFLDSFAGKGKLSRDAFWIDGLKDEALTAIWRSDSWLARQFTDRALNRYGWAVVGLAREDMGRYRDRGWIIRFVLANFWFMPDIEEPDREPPLTTVRPGKYLRRSEIDAPAKLSASSGDESFSNRS